MLSQLLLLFGFFSLVLVSVYWINRAISLFDQLIGDGQTALVFLEFTLLALPYDGAADFCFCCCGLRDQPAVFG